MTERLYYTDSYRTTFDAAVLASEDGGRRVYLDRTAFYPTSGGQPHDTGTLGGIAVVDVVDEEDRVAHLLAAPLAAARVDGTVDWARRFDHMQQHTGQHLLSAVLEERFGWATVSVHFGDTESTLDLDVAAVPADALAEAERLANALAWEDRPVTVGFEDAATAAGLRRASAREGTLRIVTIAGVDRSACGGTHVRATGELGPVLVRGTEKVKGRTRVTFLCGARAVRRARADAALLAQVAAGFSATPDDVPALVAAQAEELRTLRGARQKLLAEVAAARAAALADAAPGGPDGLRRVVVRLAAGGDEPRAVAQAFAGLARASYLAVIAEPPSLLFASSADSGLDCGALLKAAVTAAGGRGGGNARLAQGSVPDAAALERAAASLGA